MSLIEEAVSDPVPVVALIDKLKGHHASYLRQLEEARDAVGRLTGAVMATANLISLHELEEKKVVVPKIPTPEGDTSAIKEGEQPEGNPVEHQDGDCSGEATEPSDSNCDEQSGQDQQEGEVI